VPFPRKLLNEGEDVVLDLHPHWWFFIEPLLALLVSVVLGVLLLGVWDLPSWLNIPVGVVILVALGWFGVRYAKWSTTNFVVTTDRLIYRHGVLAKHGVEIPLDRVNTVFFSQSIVERMLGAGDLVIESAGELGRQSFSNVRKPSAVQNEIYKQMEANENRKFDRVGRAGPAPTPELSIPEQIAKLDDLRRRGALTEAEFQAKKAQLLERM
jgi:uncharacterized membrane protein YdbT with pleckstrin-like domain